MCQLRVIIWWVVLSGVWITTVPQLTGAEVVAGAACAVPCAVAVEAARRAIRAHWRIRVSWLAWFPPLIVAVVIDSVRLPAWAVNYQRQDGAVFDLVRLPAESDAGHAEGYRAVAAATLSASPSTVVVDERIQEHALVIHPLGGASRLRRVVGR